MPIELLTDLLLAAGALTLALLALSVRKVFTGIVLFINLGLLAALIWARLGALDVAIAEAAIGAGITGALLLAAWQKLQNSSNPPQNIKDEKRVSSS